MPGMIVTNFILIQTPTLLSLMLLLLTLFPREQKRLVAVVLAARSCMSESEDGCKQAFSDGLPLLLFLTSDVVPGCFGVPQLTFWMFVA